MTTLPSASAQPRFATLHGPRCSVVLELAPDEPPLWRYWGVRPGLTDSRSSARFETSTGTEAWLPHHALRDGRPQAPNSLEFDAPISVLPTFGVGAFHQSALLAHRAGRHFAQQFTACELQWRTPGRAFTLLLHDPVASIKVQMRWSMDDHDVLSIDTTLQNCGTDPLDVQWLASATLLLPAEAHTARSNNGQWSNEFQTLDEPLTRSLWRRENRRGRTSHDNFPGALVLSPGATAHRGCVFAAHLGWSGNHVQMIEWLPDDRRQWQWGQWLAPGEALLAAGEQLNGPTLFATCSDQGTNGVAAQLHAAVRARVPWPKGAGAGAGAGAMTPRPVLLNTWEAVYFDHREDDLRALAAAAAAIGVERFVLDDGWFEGRHHDHAALGDWWPDPQKYPAGLRPLAEHVVALGMQFGLWVEPEMVNPDSHLFRAHPDWALQLAGRPQLTGRHQLVLDIARPEVADHLFAALNTLLKTVPIRYLKWDMNRDLTTAGGADGRAAYRHQVTALYALLDRVRAAHPQVEIESCSSGGARIDYGILAHTHRVWTSDCNDAASRITIQRGALQWVPPELLGAHVGPVPFHTTGRNQSLAYRAAVALPLHMGVELDVRRLDEAQRTELGAWIALYKQLRPLLHHTQCWLGDAGDGVLWQLHGEGDANELVLLIYRTVPATMRTTPSLKLAMVRADVHYRLWRVDPVVSRNELQHGSASPFHLALADGGVTLHGAWLAAEGLPLPRMMGESAMVVRLSAQAHGAPVAPDATRAAHAAPPASP